MANQSGRIQAWAENAGVQPEGYEETFHKLADSMGLAGDTFNERFINYGRDITGEDITSMPGVEAEIARQLGHSSWNEVGYDIGDLSATRFNFNGVDQYISIPSWDTLGDSAVYGTITYSATNDQGYVTDYVIPATEFCRVGANYHNGEAWNIKCADRSPMQNANYKGGHSIGTIPEMYMENGHISFDLIIDATPGEILVGFIRDDSGSLTLEANCDTSSLVVDGNPVANGFPISVGKHYRVEFDTISGVLSDISAHGGINNLKLTTAAN